VLEEVLQQLQQLLKEFDILKKENIKLRKRVAELEEKLSKYESPKNSGNSSIPPSQDPNRQTRSSRKKSNKKTGGQKGHKGFRLEMSNNPDNVIFHDIKNCNCCGNQLLKKGTITSRQLFDLPEIKIQVTEHQVVTKVCENCGKENKSNFPDGLVQQAQYGNKIKALCVYLQNYQMLPYARCTEIIKDLTGHHLSQGSLSNFQSKCYDNLEQYETEIKKLLLQSSVLHADETGINNNGKQNWIHVLSNKKISFFGHHIKRGKQAIDDFNIIPLYNGNLVHDRFSSYFSYHCKHSLCNAHILRELIYIEEVYDSSWAKSMKKLFITANKKKKKGKKYTEKYYRRILYNYQKFITPIIANYDDTFTKTKEQRLAFALDKHKDLFLKFIKQQEIPFDNNQAERDLRMIKVKQKISGCFKSENHLKYFARIRGYITTLKKNQQNVLENIQNSFDENCFIPNLAE